MSADDPSDDELERETAAERPLASGGNARHAPRLGIASRAINPRALLEQEARGQSGELAPPPQRQRERIVAQPHVEQRRSLLSARSAAPATPSLTALPAERARAWDAYASAAVAALFPMFPDAQPEELAATAADVADALLEERKQRFG